MSEHIHIGKIVATHGIKGEIVLKHVLGKKTDFKNTEAIFIETQNQHLPFFHEKGIAKNDVETIIKLEGIDTKEAAAKLLQKKVWLTINDFENRVSKKAPVNLLGFMVIENNNKLGEVKAVIEQPHQILLEVIINNKEALIPLHDESLKKIDRKKKEVQVILPEGLLEIYLSN